MSGATMIDMSSENETHLQTVLKLNKCLEDENERLKAKIASLESLQVLVFGSSGKLGVAMVSSSDAEGTHEMAMVLMAFDVKKEELKKKGIGYELVKGVTVNEFHSDPFKHASS
jgi:uncharacterized membrane protein